MDSLNIIANALLPPEWLMQKLFLNLFNRLFSVKRKLFPMVGKTGKSNLCLVQIPTAAVFTIYIFNLLTSQTQTTVPQNFFAKPIIKGPRLDLLLLHTIDPLSEPQF